MKKILFITSLLSSIFMLFSCKNFLEGSDISKQIEKEIIIANSEKPAFISKSPEYKDTGNYKNSTISITYSHNIPLTNFRFTEEELKNLGCLDKDGKLNPDYEIEKDKAGFIYKYKYQQKDYFKCITITDSANNSLCAHFNAPEVFYNSSKNETVVQITSNEFNILPLESTLDVHVVFLDNIEDSEGIPTNNKITWQYNVKNQLDNEKPELILSSLLAAKEESILTDTNKQIKKSDDNILFDEEFIPINTSNEGDYLFNMIPKIQNILIEGEIPDFSETDNNKAIKNFFTVNHIKNKLFVKLSGHDYGNDKVEAIITIKRITDEYGDPVNDIYEDGKDTITEVTPLSRDFSITDKYQTTGIIKVSLENENFNDGLYKIEIQLSDNSSNLSDEKAIYYVVRDTSFSIPGDFSIITEYPKMYADFNFLMNLDFNNLTHNDEEALINIGKKYYGEDKFNEMYPADNDDSTNNEYINFFNVIMSESYWGWIDNGKAMSNGYFLPTAYFFNLRRQIVSFQNLQNDLIYTYQKNGKEQIIYTKSDRYLYTIDYGISPSEIDDKNKNISCLGHQWEDNGKLLKENFEYYLPAELMKFCLDNPTKNIYVNLKIQDDVGNIKTTDIYIPAQVNLVNYEYKNGKIELNLADQTDLDWSAQLNLSNYNVKLQYNIFYAKTNENIDFDNDSVYFTRNIKQKDIYDTKSETDSFTFDAEPNAQYSILIRPEFIFSRKLDNAAIGKISGPTSIFNGITAEEKSIFNIETPVFEITKNKKITNSGYSTLTITINNPEEGVTYIPEYSLDGSTYIFLNTEKIKVLDNGKKELTIKIPTPLYPPICSKVIDRTPQLKSNELTDEQKRENLHKVFDFDENDPNLNWLDKFYSQWPDYIDEFGYYSHSYYPNTILKNGVEYTLFDAIEEGYTNNVYFNVLASKNGLIKKAENAKIIEYVEDDDNTPPTFNTWSKVHNLRLSLDGKYLTTLDACVSDKEWHLKNTFTFYYTPYKEIWGNSLYILSDAEIATLPHGTGKIDTEYCRETYSNTIRDENWHDILSPEGYTQCYQESIKERSFIIIPTESIDPGDYMFFAKFEDSKGNYCYTTLGKASLNMINKTFDVSYNTSGSIDVKFDSKEKFDKKFDENTVIIQYYSEQEWKDFFINNNDYYDLNMRILSDNKITTENVSDEQKDSFFKVFGQSYNIDINSGWNYIKGAHYWGVDSTPIKQDLISKEYQTKYSEFYESITADEIKNYKDNNLNTTYNDDEIKGILATIKTNNYIESTAQKTLDDNYAAYDDFTNETVIPPSYIYIPSTSVDLFDEDKNFLSGEYGAMLLCSKPALVNFIVSDKDYGDSINLWELKGTTIDTQVFDFLPNLTLLKSNEIKSSDAKYYVVTVHFADGSQNISKVYQK